RLGARQVTVEGCVMAEDQVAGRDPNFMERAGIGEDYILTNARISSDVSGSSAVSGPDNRDAQTAVSDADESARAGGSVVQDPTGSDANRSASASSPDAADQGRQDAGAGAPAGLPDTMFELEGIDDAQLQQHVGQRVRIEGSLENLDQVRSREGGDDEAGEAADDLAE